MNLALLCQNVCNSPSNCDSRIKAICANRNSHVATPIISHLLRNIPFLGKFNYLAVEKWRMFSSNFIKRSF